MKRYLGLSATAALLMCGTAHAQTTVKIGVLSDMSSLYADIGGPGSIAAAKLAVADFTANNKDIKVETRQRRPSEQAGRRLAGRQPMVRRRQGRLDHRRAEFGRRACGQPDRGDQEQGVHRVRRGVVRSDRREMQCQHRALDLRHLDARQRHRHRDGEDRRRYLVLPHGRLRIRSRARARYRGGGREEWRQGAQQGAPSAQHQRLLVVPAAGASRRKRK